MLSVFVHGMPITQGSKRIVKRGTPQVRMIEDRADELKKWRSGLATRLLVARQAARIWDSPNDKKNGRIPYKLSVVFVLPRPESDLMQLTPIESLNFRSLKAKAPKRPTRKPDVDKLVRAVADSVTKILWRDDCQMVDLNAYKFHGQGVVGVLIQVERVDEHAFPPHLLLPLQREGFAIVGTDVVSRKK